MNYVAVDTETTGLDPINDKLVGIGICLPDNQCTYVHWNYPDEHRKKIILDYLADEKIAKVFHNATFDISFLKYNNIPIKGIVIDTNLLAFLTNENRKKDLKSLSKLFFGEESIEAYNLIREWLKKNKKGKHEYHKAPPGLLEAYCKEDARNTYNLCTKLLSEYESTLAKQKTIGMEKTIKDYLQEEMIPTEKTLSVMNTSGCRVDVNRINAYEDELKDNITCVLGELSALTWKEKDIIAKQLYEKEKDKRKSEKGKNNVKVPAFNWASNEQVGKLFFEVLGLSRYASSKTETGKWKCDEAEIKNVHDKIKDETLKEILGLFLQYKKLLKLKGTYCEGLKERLLNGRIYFNYRQTSTGKDDDLGGTLTGRLSGYLQNLPRACPEIKRFFVPYDDKYCFLYADYAQIELVVAAHLSKDMVMCTAIRNGEDLHEKTAKLIFGTEYEKDSKASILYRQVAKTCNFLLIYGGSWKKLQKTIFEDSGVMFDDDRCKEIRAKFFESYKTYANYLSEQREKMLKYNAVFSPFGLIRRLPDLKIGMDLDYKKRLYSGLLSSQICNYLEGKGTEPTPTEIYKVASRRFYHALNQGYNFPIQSTAASIMKRAMFILQEKLGYLLVQQVHDSLIIQLEKIIATSEALLIADFMENTTQLDVPIRIKHKFLNSFDEEDVCVLP